MNGFDIMVNYKKAEEHDMEVDKLSRNAVQPTASSSTAHSVMQNGSPASKYIMKTVIKLPEIVSTLQQEQFNKYCRRHEEEQKMHQKAADNSDFESNKKSSSKKKLKLTQSPDRQYSIDFTRSLKQYDYKDVVIGFNHQKFCLRWKLDSRDYDSSLNFDVMFKVLFWPYEWWVNRDLIQNTAIRFRAINGREALLKRDSAIICNGYGKN